MEFKEDHCLKLGFYNADVAKTLTIIFNEASIPPRVFGWDSHKFGTGPNGEVGWYFESERSQERLQQIKHQIGLVIQKFLIYNSCGAAKSIAVLRDSSLANNLVNVRWRKIELPFTYKELCYIAEKCLGYKTERSLEKIYGRKVVEKLVGQPFDAMSIAAIETLLSERESINLEKNGKINEIDIEYRNKRNAVIQIYDARLNELDERIKTLKMAAC